MTTPSVWSSVALATWSAEMLPDAPGLFSMMTGCPSILDKGSASVRAAMSGVEPPGKPTKIRTGFVGQTAIVSEFLEDFWALALIGRAQAAITNVAMMTLIGGIFNNETGVFMV